MSSDNAKLRLATDQDAGEALREMGYEPEHVEGTPTEQAKAMLEEARAELDEAHHLMEEDTHDWEIVGTACDDLDCIIGQMWPTDGGIQWQDGIAPMWHAVSCLTLCREIAVYGDQDAPSTGFVCGAAASLNKAATLLWGDKFTTAFESRRDEADQRKAAATLEDDTDEATDEEIAKAILDVIAKVDMDEAKSRAKADAPTTLEEAMDLLNEAADMANWLHTATDFMADGTEDAREAASIAKERAMDIMTNTMAAYYYLNGGTFADREQGTATAENATTDGETSAEIREELREMADHLQRAANALEELAELVMPNLPTGPRELFEIAETGIYDAMSAEKARAKWVAASIEKASREA